MQEKREIASFERLRATRRKAIDTPLDHLVKIEYLGDGAAMPLVISPNADHVHLMSWIQHNQSYLEENLLRYGAILFREFSIDTPSQFENCAQALCQQLFDEYGDLPREEVGKRIYTSTPYPPDKAILFHNESSHLHRWPMKICFFCAQAAQKGGETPIVDCRKVYELLDPQVRDRFDQKGIMYTRNFVDGLDVSWQQFFQTTDKAVVEQFCQSASINFEWRGTQSLKIYRVCPASVKHPRTSEMIFFNQLQLYHIACQDRVTRESLLSMFQEEDLPRNVYYGDGSPIENHVVESICNIYRHLAIRFSWRERDLLLLDNMLVAHGREPFLGPRKILVAMGDLFNSNVTQK